jgi:hypothetical protein
MDSNHEYMMANGERAAMDRLQRHAEKGTGASAS